MMAHIGKRQCLDKDLYYNSLEEVKTMFDARLSALESKIDLILATCTSVLSNCESILENNRQENHDCCARLLAPKMSVLDDLKRKLDQDDPKSPLPQTAPIVLVPSSKPSDSNQSSSDTNVQILTLNTEADMPDGSWLGDEQNPQARVRVNIPPAILLHINEHCVTPVKMALTLLDCLFHREVLAVSNLSGKGKHCKRQLDPLLIYGIRCHLVHKFNVTDNDWYRIKQNIDSKCRSVWRKKIRGIPLGMSKTSNGTAPQVTSEDSSDGSASFSFNQSDVKVLRAKDHVIHLSEGQTIKVFTDDEFKELLPSSVELFSIEESECFSLCNQSLIVGDNSEKACDDQLYTTTKPNDFLVK